MEHAEVRRLLLWNRVLLVILLLAALGAAGSSLLARLETKAMGLSASRSNGGLRLSTASDGPFIVTHLVYWEDGARSQAYAALPEPLVIIASGRASVEKEKLQKLAWRSYLGGPAPVPPEGAAITALYYRPLKATQR